MLVDWLIISVLWSSQIFSVFHTCHFNYKIVSHYILLPLCFWLIYCYSELDKHQWIQTFSCASKNKSITWNHKALCTASFLKNYRINSAQSWPACLYFPLTFPLFPVFFFNKGKGISIYVALTLCQAMCLLWSSEQSWEVDAIIMPILYLRKLKHRGDEVTCPRSYSQ